MRNFAKYNWNKIQNSYTIDNMPKYMTLKEIHRFLIKNDLLHVNNNHKINKNILKKMIKEDNYKEIPPTLFEGSEIYPSEREF